MEEIDPRDLLVEISEILNRLTIPYLITGGMAVYVWGRPRFTADIDIVVELQMEDIEKLEKALRQLSDAGYIEREMMEKALAGRGEFNFIDGVTGIKVDFWVAKGDELAKLAFKRKIPKTIKDRTIFFISPEDLILRKLEWHQQGESSKQLEDIESIIKISGKELDMEYLKTWAEKLNVKHILDKILTKKSSN